VLHALQAIGIRAELNDGAEKIGAKIRSATMAKVPYMLVIGEQEMSAGKVAVRHRTLGDQGAVTIEEFVTRIKEEVATRAATQVAEAK
jgi:threonyl-tRNA synthetase